MNTTTNKRTKLVYSFMTWLVLIPFISTSLIIAPRNIHAATLSGNRHPTHYGSTKVDLTQRAASLAIPEELGTIDERFVSQAQATGADRLVLLVQNAHANLDSEQNTAALIDWFQKELGLSLVLLEGGEGKLESLLFKSFADEALQKKLMKDYLEAGDLSGGEIAAILDSDNSLSFFGIENQSIYNENKQAFFSAMNREEELLARLEARQDALDQRANETLSDAAKTFLANVKAFRTDEMDLIEYARYLNAVYLASFPSNPSSSKPFESFSLNSSSPNTPLSFPRKRESTSLGALTGGFPTLSEKNVKFFPKSAPRTHASVKTFGDDIIGKMLREVERSDNSDAYINGVTDVQENLGVSGRELFDEIEALEAWLRGSLPKTNAERDILAENHQISILRDFARLELLPKDWQGLRSLSLQEPTSVVIAKPEQPNERAEAISRLRQLEIASSPAAPRNDNVFEHHYKFYRLAEQRDEVLFENALRLIEKQKAKVSLISTGGFHKEGTTARLREQNISYVVISPKIETLEGREKYMNAMKGERSFRNSFEDNLWESFARDYTEKLSAALKPHERNVQLKRWRDRIIQNAIAEGRVAQAGQYTKYVDAIARGEAVEVSIETKLNRFSEGLKEMWETGDITAASVTQLFHRIHAAPTSNLMYDLTLASRGATIIRQQPKIEKSLPRAEVRAPVAVDVKETVLRSPTKRIMSGSVSEFRKIFVSTLSRLNQVSQDLNWKGVELEIDLIFQNLEELEDDPATGEYMLEVIDYFLETLSEKSDLERLSLDIPERDWPEINVLMELETLRGQYSAIVRDHAPAQERPEVRTVPEPVFMVDEGGPVRKLDLNRPQLKLHEGPEIPFAIEEVPRLQHDLNARMTKVYVYFYMIQSEISTHLDPETTDETPTSLLELQTVIEEYDEKKDADLTVDEFTQLLGHLYELFSDERISTLISDLNDLLPQDDPSSRKSSFVDALNESADRIRSFSGRNLGLEGMEPTLIQLNTVLEEFKTLSAYRDYLELEFTEGDVNLFGDRVALERALENLIKNAVEAVKQKAATEGEGFKGRVIARTIRQDDGATVLLELEDNGVGIPDENVKVMLAPETLFTTKGDGGTGYGVTNAVAAIESFGGEVHGTSTVGKGTTFRLTLPLTARAEVRHIRPVKDINESAPQSSRARTKRTDARAEVHGTRSGWQSPWQFRLRSLLAAVTIASILFAFGPDVWRFIVDQFWLMRLGNFVLWSAGILGLFAVASWAFGRFVGRKGMTALKQQTGSALLGSRRRMIVTSSMVVVGSGLLIWLGYSRRTVRPEKFRALFETNANIAFLVGRASQQANQDIATDLVTPKMQQILDELDQELDVLQLEVSKISRDPDPEALDALIEALKEYDLIADNVDQASAILTSKRQLQNRLQDGINARDVKDIWAGDIKSDSTPPTAAQRALQERIPWYDRGPDLVQLAYEDAYVAGGKSAVTPLATAINDTANEGAYRFLRTAERALGRLKDPVAIPGLTQAFRRGVVFDQNEILIALEKIGHFDKSVDAVLNTIQETARNAEIPMADPEVISSFLKTANRSYPKTLDQILSWLEDEDEVIRCGAAYILGELDDQRALPALETANEKAQQNNEDEFTLDIYQQAIRNLKSPHRPEVRATSTRAEVRAKNDRKLAIKFAKDYGLDAKVIKTLWDALEAGKGPIRIQMDAIVGVKRSARPAVYKGAAYGMEFSRGKVVGEDKPDRRLTFMLDRRANKVSGPFYEEAERYPHADQLKVSLTLSVSPATSGVPKRMRKKAWTPDATMIFYDPKPIRVTAIKILTTKKNAKEKKAKRPPRIRSPKGQKKKPKTTRAEVRMDQQALNADNELLNEVIAALFDSVRTDPDFDQQQLGRFLDAQALLPRVFDRALPGAAQTNIAGDGRATSIRYHRGLFSLVATRAYDREGRSLSVQEPAQDLINVAKSILIKESDVLQMAQTSRPLAQVRIELIERINRFFNQNLSGIAVLPNESSISEAHQMDADAYIVHSNSPLYKLLQYKLAVWMHQEYLSVQAKNTYLKRKNFFRDGIYDSLVRAVGDAELLHGLFSEAVINEAASAAWTGDELTHKLLFLRSFYSGVRNQLMPRLTPRDAHYWALHLSYQHENSADFNRMTEGDPTIDGSFGDHTKQFFKFLADPDFYNVSIADLPTPANESGAFFPRSKIRAKSSSAVTEALTNVVLGIKTDASKVAGQLEVQRASGVEASLLVEAVRRQLQLNSGQDASIPSRQHLNDANRLADAIEALEEEQVVVYDLPMETMFAQAKEKNPELTQEAFIEQFVRGDAPHIAETIYGFEKLSSYLNIRVVASEIWSEAVKAVQIEHNRLRIEGDGILTNQLRVTLGRHEVPNATLANEAAKTGLSVHASEDIRHNPIELTIGHLRALMGAPVALLREKDARGIAKEGSQYRVTDMGFLTAFLHVVALRARGQYYTQAAA